MKLKTSIVAITVAVLLVGGVLGTSAFTTFNADRGASIDVVDDSSGILALSPGASPFVTLDSGELSIDVTNGGASGVNVNSVLSIGDGANATSDYAFSVTNNDGEAHDLTFDYTLASSDSDADANVEYTVYDSTGSEVGTFSENSEFSESGVPAGETYYVVLNVDTQGSTTADDLTGTVALTAE